MPISLPAPEASKCLQNSCNSCKGLFDGKGRCAEGPHLEMPSLVEVKLSGQPSRPPRVLSQLG